MTIAAVPSCKPYSVLEVWKLGVVTIPRTVALDPSSWLLALAIVVYVLNSEIHVCTKVLFAEDISPLGGIESP